MNLISSLFPIVGPVSLFLAKSLRYNWHCIPTELKMTEWKTMVHISASFQSSIAEQQKIVLADGSLCSRQQIV